VVRRRKRDASKIASLDDLELEDGLNIDFEGDEDSPLESPIPNPNKTDMGLSKSSNALLANNEILADTMVFSSEALLNKKEREFYLKRRADYLEDFTLNKSSDIGLIHRVVMEEIIQERLYTSYINEPTKDLSEKISESLSRYRASQEALGTSRDKRIRNRETGAQSVADLAKAYFEDRKERIEKMKASREEEERAVLTEMEHSFGLQYDGVTASEKTGWEVEQDGADGSN
jgi:hypothetical protein